MHQQGTVTRLGLERDVELTLLNLVNITEADITITVCACSAVQPAAHLTSWFRMLVSRPPEDSVERFQASAETRAECPRSCRTCFTLSASQIWTCTEPRDHRSEGCVLDPSRSSTECVARR